MIVTVTANPSLDLTYRLEHDLVSGAEVHRAHATTLEASGKGVNVSRALTAAGQQTCAVVAAGGATGRHLLELLALEDVPYRAVIVAASTRVNASVLQPRGGTVARSERKQGGTVRNLEAFTFILSFPFFVCIGTPRAAP